MRDTTDASQNKRLDTLAMFWAELEEEQAEEEQKLPKRAALFCRAVQDGLSDRGFLEANEITPGHTLERHVGKDDAFILERARTLREASTFTDIETAESAIAETLSAMSDEIDQWLDTQPERAGRFIYDVGWTAGRVTDRSGVIRSSAVVNLVLEPTEHGYQIKTAYLL